MLNENNLRMIRTFYGLNQRELAEKVGVSQSYITHVEIGSRNISDNLRSSIIEALGLTEQKVEQIAEYEAARERIAGVK